MKTFRIELNEQQLQIVNALLVEAPYRIAAPLVSHINSQIQKHFDNAVDAVGAQSGATYLPDQFSGD